MGEQKEGVEEEPPSSHEAERHTSPWQTGVHQREQREFWHEEEEKVEEQPQLRRSTRQRKPNPKYANVAIVMEENEHITYEDASEKDRATLKSQSLVKN